MAQYDLLNAVLDVPAEVLKSDIRMQALYKVWQSRQSAGGEAALSASDIAPWAGNLMVLEAVDAAVTDMRIQHFGAHLVRTYGANLTDSTVFDASPSLAQIWLPVARHALQFFKPNLVAFRKTDETGAIKSTMTLFLPVRKSATETVLLVASFNFTAEEKPAVQAPVLPWIGSLASAVAEVPAEAASIAPHILAKSAVQYRPAVQA